MKSLFMQILRWLILRGGEAGWWVRRRIQALHCFGTYYHRRWSAKTAFCAPCGPASSPIRTRRQFSPTAPRTDHWRREWRLSISIKKYWGGSPNCTGILVGRRLSKCESSQVDSPTSSDWKSTENIRNEKELFPGSADRFDEDNDNPNNRSNACYALLAAHDRNFKGLLIEQATRKWQVSLPQTSWIGHLKWFHESRSLVTAAIAALRSFQIFSDFWTHNPRAGMGLF